MDSLRLQQILLPGRTRMRISRIDKGTAGRGRLSWEVAAAELPSSLPNIIAPAATAVSAG